MSFKPPRELEATPAQTKFIEAVFSGYYTELMYGGAIRGGKTVALLMTFFVLCRVFAGSRWAIVRKNLPTLKRNTIPAFNKFRPSFVEELNKSTWEAECTNGSSIIFFPESVATDPGYNRWAGLEVNGFGGEECNELAPETFTKMTERAGTWIIQGVDVQPPPINVFTTNPDDGYVKIHFHDPFHSGTLLPHRYFQPATIHDNPHLPQAFLDNLERMKETNPQMYERYVVGNWAAMEHPEQLISWAWCRAACEVQVEPGEKRLGVDVARSENPGADDTVLAQVDGNIVQPLRYYHGVRTDETADLILADIDKRGTLEENIVVDTVGVGAGVADTLIRNDIYIHSFVAGGKAVEEKDTMFTFRNRRSQAWWNFREMLKNGQIAFKREDLRLFEELTAPRYKTSGDKMIEVESKDSVKKRIGRSTDAADAVIMAFAPREHVQEVFLI